MADNPGSPVVAPTEPTPEPAAPAATSADASASPPAAAAALPPALPVLAPLTPGPVAAPAAAPIIAANNAPVAAPALAAMSVAAPPVLAAPPTTVALPVAVPSVMPSAPTTVPMAVIPSTVSLPVTQTVAPIMLTAAPVMQAAAPVLQTVAPLVAMRPAAAPVVPMRPAAPVVAMRPAAPVVAMRPTAPVVVMRPAAPVQPPAVEPKLEKIESKSPADKNTLLAVLQLLRKYNLKSTEEILKKEANFADLASFDSGSVQSDSEVSSVLSAYKSEGDPEAYDGAYTDLKKFVESALDIYKHELGTILYPVFVHMYLELVYNGHENIAIAFMKKFTPEQEDYYQDDLRKLAQVTKRDHMKDNELTDTFKSSEFIIRMSRDTLSILKRHLKEKKRSVVPNIVQEHLYFDMYEGVARNKQQIDATAGAVVGEATRQDNKARVYYGLLKEPDLQFVQQEEEEEPDNGESDKPKKKKAKKDPIFSKKSKTDPNAPTVDRMPLPELKDIDKQEKVRALREASKRVNLGPDTLPSICCYTLLNSCHSVTSAEIAEDSSMLAVGFSNSTIKVWSIVPLKLRAMKSAELLADIDKEAEDVLVRMMDDKSAETSKMLFGHHGPVYSMSFSPDRNLLLSSSEDTTIRLWSLQIWTCLVVYKGHGFPVWSVRFSPHGFYFASAAHDRTARLWCTDNPQPLRVFAGHFSDVDVVQFHPNSNYIATGSSDRTVRLWDCVTGNHVRLMTGHKAPICTLSFSVEGRFLASAGADTHILLWDLAHGHLLAELSGHTAPIHTLAFSRCGNILTSGSLDCSVKLWDFQRLAKEIALEDVNVTHNPDIKRGDNQGGYMLRTYATKSTPVLNLHYTRRNVLLAVGVFEANG